MKSGCEREPRSLLGFRQALTACKLKSKRWGWSGESQMKALSLGEQCWLNVAGRRSKMKPDS